MITFTAPHDMGMKLKPLLSAIADGFRTVISGRAWIKLRKRLAIIGTIRAMEVTYGEHGWHPDLHVLVDILVRSMPTPPGQPPHRVCPEAVVDFIVKAGSPGDPP